MAERSRRRQATTMAISNSTSSMKAQGPIWSKYWRRAGARNPSKHLLGPASISARSGCNFSARDDRRDTAHLPATWPALSVARPMGRGAVARGGGACARSAWTAQYIRDVSIDRGAIAQFNRSAATTRPRRLSSRKILVARHLHHAAALRSDARARTVHSPRRVPDRNLSRRVQLRALAGRRIFLEQDRPGIHADVDRGRVVFPGARRRRDLARSSSRRARILTANALECSGRFRYHHLQGKAAPGAAGRLKQGASP